MSKKPKIALLRWEKGQVCDALLQLETLPGNSTNPASYPFDVEMVYVKGANAETVETNPCQELLDDGVVQNVAQYYMKLHGLGQVEYHYGVMDNFYTIYFIF